jgi:hypothetical protein
MGSRLQDSGKKGTSHYTRTLLNSRFMPKNTSEIVDMADGSSLLSSWADLFVSLLILVGGRRKDNTTQDNTATSLCLLQPRSLPSRSLPRVLYSFSTRHL